MNKKCHTPGVLPSAIPDLSPGRRPFPLPGSVKCGCKVQNPQPRRNWRYPYEKRNYGTGIHPGPQRLHERPGGGHHRRLQRPHRKAAAGAGAVLCVHRSLRQHLPGPPRPGKAGGGSPHDPAGLHRWRLHRPDGRPGRRHSPHRQYPQIRPPGGCAGTHSVRHYHRRHGERQPPLRQRFRQGHDFPSGCCGNGSWQPLPAAAFWPW